jgi:hypothetical protein
MRALDGAPLSRFSVDERLRLNGDRKTECKEDAWYSLSGIFDVEIAPAYSEGAASAFKRLKGEIDKLEICIRDIRNSDPRHDKQRIEDTKGGLLADSYRWVLDNTPFQQWREEPNSRLLWVKGDPGKGKTMLLCGIINELQISKPQSALLSYKPNPTQITMAIGIFTIFAGLVALAAGYFYFFGISPETKRKMENQALKIMGENKMSCKRLRCTNRM